MSYIDKSGQGHTILVLTDAESRLIRGTLERQAAERSDPDSPVRPYYGDAVAAFKRGVQRGTERMAAEFKEEQKAGKK